MYIYPSYQCHTYDDSAGFDRDIVETCLVVINGVKLIELCTAPRLHNFHNGKSIDPFVTDANAEKGAVRRNAP